MTQGDQLPHTPETIKFPHHNGSYPQTMNQKTRGWIIQPEKEKNKPVLKMLWCSDTVTTKITNTIPSLTTLIRSVASVLIVTLSAIINWPTCQFKSLFYQLRLTVLFTESKRIFNTASLKCRLSYTFSVLIYFSSYWVLRVPLWHTCNLQSWGTWGW